MKISYFCALCTTALLLVPFTSAVRADSTADQIQSLIAKEASSVVTVKVVLKNQFKAGGQAQDMESRTELQGTVVSSDGLIMVSNSAFSAQKLTELLGGMGGSAAGADLGFKITPTDFKVVFEREDKEYPAFLAASDETLGLAFLQVEELAGRTLTPVSLEHGTAPTLGEELFSVSRLSKGFDYAPYYSTSRVSGEIAKPRQAWLLDGSIGGQGMLVFQPTGEVAGVVTAISSGIKDPSAAGAMGMGMFMRMMGLGDGGNMHTGLFVIPAETVNTVIGLAKQQAVTIAAKRAAAKAATPVPAPIKPVKPSK